MRHWLGAAALTTVVLTTSPASAAGTIRIAAQKTGTVAWELDVIRRHGLDREAGLTLDITDLASVETGKIALKGGSADVMVTDWLWVSRERALGGSMQFVPYSATVGAVMVPPTSGMATLADLRGKKLGVAGGPLDKSWLILRAAAKQDGIDLKTEAQPVYGAPPLLFEKTQQGELDANLNYWNFCARLEAKGYRRLASVAEAAASLGATGPVSMLGYVFDEAWAKANKPALDAFLAASRKAKDILATSDAEWEAIRPLTMAPDDATLTVYRDRFREGIPRRPVADEEIDARKLFRVMADLGGADLVGPGKELDPGTYYKAGPGL
jgi:NitT/TauT family transport system substrate-binding protein